MGREDLHFRLRIPEALKSQIEIAAQENRRSMTAEIVARLEQSLAADSQIKISYKLGEAADPDAAVEFARHQLRQALASLEFSDKD